MEDLTNPNELDGDEGIAEHLPARFVSELNLPSADPASYQDAKAAVQQEYRDSSKWKRLYCEKVSIFSERDRGTVFMIHVNKSIEFDWTWEGAVAFRPIALDENTAISNRDAEDFLYADDVAWRGEVLEIDEKNGCLFISLDHPEALPTVGSFFVRPFEFLAVLQSVFSEPAFEEVQQGLPSRLNAAEGHVHPLITSSASPPCSLSKLAGWWQRSWSVLWGPPGTGKTWTTGQQVAAALSDPTERILVISTTNRATDAVAIALGDAAKAVCPSELLNGNLLRLGKGAALPLFQERDLGMMLRGTEAEILMKITEVVERLRQAEDWEDKAFARKQIASLRGASDQSGRLFVDANVRVVVSTAFKAMTCLKAPVVSSMLAQGEAPFTTIFIDEAGLMSRAAIAALSYLAARRVVLVGDSKQLAPISRIARVLPTRQQRWMASSGLSHLDELDNTPSAVYVLREQRRMHPEVCDVVSKYQYRGGLTTAEETRNRETQAPPLLTHFSRAIWYVLDAEGKNLASIRAERGPGNRSFVRGITTDVLEKLFSDPDVRQSKGLFISPFRAQAQAISAWLATNGISKWEASTVHSQQGAEADIVVFDTVNASNCAWPMDEWQRLVNVGLSRARESVILLASESEMEEPYLRPLRKLMTPAVLIQEQGHLRWQAISPTENRTAGPNRVGEEVTQYRNACMGQQIADRKKMSPILSREQQRLSNLTLDGKPRLVRGVAGSGKSIVLCNWMAKIVQRMEANSNARIWAVYANRSLQKMLRESIETAWNGLSVGNLFDQGEFPWHKVSLLHVRDVLAGILPDASLSMNDFDFDYDRAAEEFLQRQDVASLLPRCTALFIDEAQDMGPSTLRLLLSIVEQTDEGDPNSRPAHIFFDNAQNVYGRKTPKWTEFGLDMRGRSTILRESFRSTKPITELAVNVLQRLSTCVEAEDQNELAELGLIEIGKRNGKEWSSVNFSEVNGPKPIFHLFNSRAEEIDKIAQHLKNLILVEQISPHDICLLYVGEYVADVLTAHLSPVLESYGVELSVQKNRSFERRENTLLVTTPHSYKGYESEVVIIPCVDQYVSGEGQILANPLYVAMTRARSLLAIYGHRSSSTPSHRLVTTLEECTRQL